jgi:nucleotide-binding universal stress UspA family protein
VSTTQQRPAGIVVGYDGADDGDVALAWAATSAERTHEPLTVVIVEDLSINDGSGPWSEGYWDDVEQRARATLRALDSPAPDVRRLRGRPFDVLLDLASVAGLLVVGSRGHGRVGEVMLGSVSQHLTGHAECPVVVARPAERPDARRIVVGTDGSDPAARALDLACRRAETTGETVAAVSGFRVSHLPVDRHGNLPESVSAHLLQREHDLDSWVAPARDAHPDVRVEADVVPLPAGQALVDASSDATLVVVGTRGRTALTRLILGSTSHEVLHRAHCSVAVVR